MVPRSALFTALVVGGLLPVSVERVFAMSEIECEIKSQASTSGMVFTGVIWATRKTVGDYKFMVSKHGPGGTSNVVQRGLFAVGANKSSVVGTVAVNAGAGDQVLARLTITSNGHEICTAEL